MRFGNVRWLGLLIGLSACTEAGAHLTLSAPNGPATVASFDVVLATPDQVPTIGNQRIAPDRLEVQTVAYYLQRTIAGGEHDPVDRLDGFTVRIEPDATLPDTQFIPFVLMYDGPARSGNIVAVATFHAADSRMPSPILVVRDEIDKYTLDVEPVVQVSDREPVAPGQARAVLCQDENQRSFTSGVVWRPAGGGEMRLLFPDDDGLDATGRALDLDCDHHPVTAESAGADCDDTRDLFHRDAQEACDGLDTNCDGLQSLVVTCSAAGTNVCADPAGNGLALCNDRTGTQTQCQSDPQCLCANASAGCTSCVIENELGSTAGALKPCQPGLGYLLAPSACTDAARCMVEVVGVHGGWYAEVATDATSSTFGQKAINVFGKYWIKVKRPEAGGVEIPGVRGDSTGEVDLVITPASGAPLLVPVDLRFSIDGATCSGGGPFTMYCSQL